MIAIFTTAHSPDHTAVAFAKKYEIVKHGKQRTDRLTVEAWDRQQAKHLPSASST